LASLLDQFDLSDIVPIRMKFIDHGIEQKASLLRPSTTTLKNCTSNLRILKVKSKVYMTYAVSNLEETECFNARCP
jgi:hypothetical protein